jgi:hypothetical protein
MPLNSTTAIQRLTQLREETGATATDHSVNSWKTRVRSVLALSLGESSHIVQEFDGIWFTVGVYYDGQPESDFAEARTGGHESALGYIESAIYELGLIGGEQDVVQAESYDAGLWEHVRRLVESQDWNNLSASVAIYVEDRVRTWADLPNTLVGHGLYARAFANDGALRLGISAGEWEGWKQLAMGLAQGVGNANRHRVEARADARKYGLGVLGLGSLLLTQIRWEHPNVVNDASDQ